MVAVRRSHPAGMATANVQPIDPISVTPFSARLSPAVPAARPDPWYYLDPRLNLRFIHDPNDYDSGRSGAGSRQRQEEREQRARESIALDLYREGQITLRTMGRLAGVGDDYWAADAFRARHGLPVNALADAPDADQAAIARLLTP